MRTEFRDCDAWRKDNLPMSTTSNEACKLFDVSVSQIAGFYEDQQYGGLMKSLQSMGKADPEFILGQCLIYGAQILGSDVLLNSKESHENVKKLVDKANSLANSLNKREKMHVAALDYIQKGNLPKAIDSWQGIVNEYPNDMMALKFAYSSYFYTGQFTEMTNLVADAMPRWNKSAPLYNYLHGLYAFGLAHTNKLDEAEKNAKIGLDANANVDGWSTHSISHVNEYRSTYDKGIKFLLDTEAYWTKSNLISNHNYWHLCLYYVEKNQHENVFGIVDSKLNEPKSSYDMIDLASLLLRLQIDDCKQSDYVLDKYKLLKKTFADRLNKHGYLYFDIHKAMIIGTCGTDEEKASYVSSLKSFIENEVGLDLAKSIIDLNKQLGQNLLAGIGHFFASEYDECVKLLYPIRGEIIKIGGSHAQRDIVELILLVSALQANDAENKKLGLRLMSERRAERPESGLTQRIANRLASSEHF